MKRNSKGQITSGKDSIQLNEHIIREKYLSGMSLKNIGVLLNVSDKTIMRRLDKMGVPRRNGTFQKGHAPHQGIEKGWVKKGQRSLVWKTGIRYNEVGYRLLWVVKKRKYVREHSFIISYTFNR